MNQLTKGTQVEREHAATWHALKAGRIKTSQEFFAAIAKDHLKEDPLYYDKLAAIEKPVLRIKGISPMNPKYILITGEKT